LPSFDVHQHLWPEELVAALANRREIPRLRGSVLELDEGRFEVDLDVHRLDRRLEELDRDGIDVAIVSFPPTMAWESARELAVAYHEGIERLVAESRGRLRAFACGECRVGYAGACISGRRLIAGVDGLASELVDAGQALFVHPGPPEPAPADAPPWWTAVVDYTAQMQAAFAWWIAQEQAAASGVPVVFAILGGGAPFQLERLRGRGGPDATNLLDSNVFLDTASYGHRALELCVSMFGVRPLLYGSDVPVVDSRPTLQALTGFGDAVKDVVMTENPTALFG
jgi:predicted TIM-barrel fold metal-dependent hydrolase